MSVGSFADRDMVMRYHYGFGIGHTYSHTQPASMIPSAQQQAYQERNCDGMDDEDDANHTDGSKRPADTLEIEFDELESDEPSSSTGSDSEPDDESGDSDTESILGDYADMDGDAGCTFDEYEF